MGDEGDDGQEEDEEEEATLARTDLPRPRPGRRPPGGRGGAWWVELVAVDGSTPLLRGGEVGVGLATFRGDRVCFRLGDMVDLLS